ncbi:hypothetical protein F2P56_001520 [Juglans regia]|uniref:Uncharacterized protein n=1 Tax=Juglans regia TaxID=51240 RepID=A0A833YC89_JUGRE|nr:hypothetical protein F2P56_001520 [Juglans regia]
MIRYYVEANIADVRIRTREYGDVVNRENRHVVEANEFAVLDLHRERQDVKAVVAEPKHGVPEHQAHDSGLSCGIDLVRHRALRMERERERGHPLDVARERRERSDEALKAVNHHQAVVEKIRLSDLHSSDEDLGSGGEAAILGPFGGDGDASAWAQRLDPGTESKLPEIVDREDARNNVFSEEVRDGARDTGTEGGIGGSEESVGTGPGHGGGGGRKRGCGCGELVEAEMGEDRRE